LHDQATHTSDDDGKSEGGSPPLALIGARIGTRWRRLTRWHSGIGLRLLVRVLLFSSAITLLLTLLQLYLDYRRDVGTIDRQISEIERSYRPSLGEGLWNLDARQLELQVDGILHLPDIRFVEVREATDRGNPMVVTAGSHQANADVHREFPIFHTNRGVEQTLGVLSIDATLDDVYRRLFDTAIVILISQAAKTFVLSFFILYIVNRLVTRHLVTAAKFLGGYDLRRSPPPLRLERRPLQRGDELDQLVGAFNGMSVENSRLYRDLEDREGKIRRLVDANILGIFFWNLEGAIVGANEAFLHMLQYGREDLVSGRVRWTDLTPPEWRERDERAVMELKGTGTVQPYETEFFRKDGSRVSVLIGRALFQDGGHEGVAFVLDSSEQKRAEAEIRALKDQLYKENLVLRDEVDRTSMFEEIVGASQAQQAVLARVAKVAWTDSTVLITGETGTGKELVARAIHRRSSRSSRAFVSVSCAAIPRDLIASELFGHEKGAFTGAVQRRLGRFELADGGTIFLDEVGELAPDTQVALLRVLQEREFERVGGSQPIHVDVRVIAATNRDLNAAVANGTFRQDLFYRLNVFPLEMPPLRERREDIPVLVEYFIDRYARKAGKTIRHVNKRTLDRLQSYPWPGNVRELQNVIERSVIVCDTDEFTVDDSWLSAGPAVESRLALSSTVAAHEKATIEEALRASGGRVFGPSGAAARLGIARSTLESKIRALGINKNRFRGRPATQ
jgi:PAS domain S-box-containing protein